MIPLFTTSSLALLESLSFTKTLYAFDFDGTLAKLVTNPADAYMSPTTEKLLQRLSELAPVAIISGRSLSDLKQRIKVEPQFLVGSHGLEGVRNDTDALAEAQKICANWLTSLQSLTLNDGISIEDKKYSLSVHFRQSANKAAAKALIMSAADALTPPPRIIPGKAVVNLVTAKSPNKGAAILDLISQTGSKHVFYIGDDDTDEDIFELPYRDGQLMSVRVGPKKVSVAKYYIERQSEINRLLTYLIGYHEAQQS